MKKLFSLLVMMVLLSSCAYNNKELKAMKPGDTVIVQILKQPTPVIVVDNYPEYKMMDLSVYDNLYTAVSYETIKLKVKD